MNNPLVSIVIPVYNGANFLEEAINSALSQIYTNIEIIVVNDGSNDNGKTREIALSFKDKIRYFEKTNGGVSSALNYAIGVMKGEYFSWLSHDDLYYPEKILMQIDALKKMNSDTAIVYSEFDFLYQNTGKKVSSNLIMSYTKKSLENPDIIVTQNLVNGISLLMNKKHFERVGLFDEKLIAVQDYDLWFRMLLNQKIIFIDKPLVVSRVHNKQVGVVNPICIEEINELYINFTNNLPEENIIRTFGSKYNYYYRMRMRYKTKLMKNYPNYPEKLLKDITEPQNVKYYISKFLNEIQEMYNSKMDLICIFGAGDWGRILAEELSDRGVKVDFFVDNNENLWGNKILDIICISLDDLNEKPRDMLIIIANSLNFLEIKEQLKSMGFKCIALKQNIDKLLFDTPPIQSELSF